MDHFIHNSNSALWTASLNHRFDARKVAESGHPRRFCTQLASVQGGGTPT
jgi:hypothetical protein